MFISFVKGFKSNQFFTKMKNTTLIDKYKNTKKQKIDYKYKTIKRYKKNIHYIIVIFTQYTIYNVKPNEIEPNHYPITYYWYTI